jgi:hypothetical protein
MTTNPTAIAEKIACAGELQIVEEYPSKYYYALRWTLKTTNIIKGGRSNHEGCVRMSQWNKVGIYKKMVNK